MLNLLHFKFDYDFCVKFLLNYLQDENISVKELSYAIDMDYWTLRKFLFEGPVNGRNTFKIINFIINSKGGVIFYEDYQIY